MKREDPAASMQLDLKQKDSGIDHMIASWLS